MMVDLVGFAATAASCILWLPQIATVWRNRHHPAALAGVSMATQYFVILSGVLWGVYAVLTHAFWTGAPVLLNIPLAVGTILLVERGRRTVAAMPAAEMIVEDTAESMTYPVLLDHDYRGDIDPITSLDGPLAPAP